MSTREDVPRYVAAPWDRVSVEHRPVPLPLTRRLGRTDDGLAVSLTRVLVYPRGAAVRLRAALRPDARDEVHDLYAAMTGFGDLPYGDRLQITIDLGDGRVATNEEIHAPPGGRRPAASLVIVDGQGDGGTLAESEHWAWPLPDAGDVAMIVAWPARGLGPVAVHLDGSALRRAAASATALWPGARLPPPTDLDGEA